MKLSINCCLCKDQTTFSTTSKGCVYNVNCVGASDEEVPCNPVHDSSHILLWLHPSGHLGSHKCRKASLCGVSPHLHGTDSRCLICGMCLHHNPNHVIILCLWRRLWMQKQYLLCSSGDSIFWDGLRRRCCRLSHELKKRLVQMWMILLILLWI